ncbi:MAG TPA: SAM-dependent methyltransferase [Candidatus Saccharimonadales bacterium]|nr:SAM-dependent methyltransferase [Candidatus Saccharimonadales bacterium]
MRPLIEVIRREVAASGVLSFARFMELALYCPDYGFYEAKKDNLGRRGDFFTSVSVGELFGQLLAFQFAEWLEALRITNCELRIVEAGAHDGTLANDILNWLQAARPNLFEQIHYGIIEPSLRRQEWQKEKLEKFGSAVRWFSDFEHLKLRAQSSKLAGIVFSNELLDAMPVRRFGWDATAKKWFEWGVAFEGEKFTWAKIWNSEFRIQNSELETVLPDGYIVEISPAAENWWREAASALGCGWLMTLDYGFTADELFSPARPRGTLRAYFRHHLADDPLANVGEQDITAHVNFSTIQAAGEAAGLTTQNLFTQTHFLIRILEKAIKDKSFGEWNVSRARQFQTLTHPEHLGRAFRALIQSKGLLATRS